MQGICMIDFEVAKKILDEKIKSNCIEDQIFNFLMYFFDF